MSNAKVSPSTSVLVVDLDGTLTPADTLVECLIRILRKSPRTIFALIKALLQGRAQFKEGVAKEADALGTTVSSNLPLRDELVQYLRAERASGRTIVLATAAHSTVATAVAERLQLFDLVLSTGGGKNLKGEAKLQAIREKFGTAFVYAGDSSADLPIWNGASGAVLVGPAGRLAKAIKVPIERYFPASIPRWRSWLRALRPHQWIKNTLVFVPLFTSFSFVEAPKVFTAGLAFFAFCLAASATYLVNDVGDFESDRSHPRKRQRPFASGELPLLQGLAGALVLFVLAILVGLLVSPLFAIMLCAYAALATSYSLTLKQYVVLDVLVLATLYTWRVLAGAVAISVAVSTWLLAFAAFMFFSLALVKRCSELITIQKVGGQAATGRNYTVADLAVLWPLGVSTGVSAVVVLGLYIGSPEAAKAYALPEVLWIAAAILAYWIARLWIKTGRGEMHDDPLVFSIRDSGSRRLIALIGLMVLVAHFARLG